MKDNKGLSRKVIIGTFIRLRSSGADGNMVRVVCNELGYTIDKNGSNDFVRRVLKEYLGESRAALNAPSYGTDGRATSIRVVYSS